MALRVLLADESSTIKKVFQLALQDFAVDVRPVNIGLDVLKVAQSFKPDIIFADVLLQKKNGYEVSAELKQDGEMKATPVVLMWSGFMEFDEDKFQASLANASLEKPFDVAALRKLINDLVPRTKDQRLSQFLTFPNPPPQAAAPSGTGPQIDAGPAEEFKHISIPKMKGTAKADTPPSAPQAKPSNNDPFRLNLTPEDLDPDHIPVQYQDPSAEANKPASEPSIVIEDFVQASAVNIDFGALREASAAPNPGNAATTPSINLAAFEELEGPQRLTPVAPTPAPHAPQATAMPPTPAAKSAPPPGPVTASVSAAGTSDIPVLNEEQLEKIIRAQSGPVIESVVWKVIPELATQIIERELKKLLADRDAF